jgi:hypothetical protein
MNYKSSIITFWNTCSICILCLFLFSVWLRFGYEDIAAGLLSQAFGFFFLMTWPTKGRKKGGKGFEPVTSASCGPNRFNYLLRSKPLACDRKFWQHLWAIRNISAPIWMKAFWVRASVFFTKMMDPELEVVSKFNPILSHSQIVNMIIGVNSWSCEVCMNHLEAK